MTKQWNHTMFSSRSAGNCWARVVFVRMLTKWRRFHFSYHPLEVLKEGSSESSLALRRSINPLTAIPTKNKKITFLFWCKITVDSWLQHSFRDMLWNCHNNNIFLTNQILCFPRTERRYHSTFQKLLKFQIKRVNTNFVLFAVKTTPSLAGLVWDISEWNGPSLLIWQTSSAHQKEWSPGLFSSVVPWTRLVHILERFPSCFVPLQLPQ